MIDFHRFVDTFMVVFLEVFDVESWAILQHFFLIGFLGPEGHAFRHVAWVDYDLEWLITVAFVFLFLNYGKVVII